VCFYGCLKKCELNSLLKYCISKDQEWAEVVRVLIIHELDEHSSCILLSITVESALIPGTKM